MTDIVERLRAPAYWISGSSEGHEGENSAPGEAADEIERLRAALEPFAVAADCFDGWPIKDPEQWYAYGGTQGGDTQTGAITVGDLRRARVALQQEVK